MATKLGQLVYTTEGYGPGPQNGYVYEMPAALRVPVAMRRGGYYACRRRTDCGGDVIDGREYDTLSAAKAAADSYAS